MRVVLVSTYDLGRQPFGLASPAAWLRRAGIETECVDTSRDDLTDEQIAAASLVAFYLPMHTATRLALPLVERVRRVNPAARLCAYGLYAPLNAECLRDRGVDCVLGPEAEADLVQLALSNDRARGASHWHPTAPAGAAGTPPEGLPGKPEGFAPLAKLAFIRPDRAGLPSLKQYAALEMPDGEQRLVGSTDASRGCKHLCLHCPIVPVYRGQFRVVPVDIVLDDIRAQVAAGAQHISFGDPDFLNGPAHARRVVERLASTFPQLTYDATIKIEHLLKHADMLPVLRETGCLFVTSAVESIDDEMLRTLRKGHTRADFIEVVGLCRRVGLMLNPTFVPFTPWTTVDGYIALLEELQTLGLVDAVAPIQLAIRLLVTASSPLLGVPAIASAVDTFEPASLAWPWRHEDPRVDELQQAVMRVVAVDPWKPRAQIFADVARVAYEYAGRERRPSRRYEGPPVPHLTEPWYCCAEPVGI